MAHFRIPGDLTRRAVSIRVKVDVREKKPFNNYAKCKPNKGAKKPFYREFQGFIAMRISPKLVLL